MQKPKHMAKRMFRKKWEENVSRKINGGGYEKMRECILGRIVKSQRIPTQNNVPAKTPDRSGEGKKRPEEEELRHYTPLLDESPQSEW